MSATLTIAIILARGGGLDSPGEWLLFGGIAAAMLAFWGFSAWRRRVRTQELRALAPTLGFSFTDDEPLLVEELEQFQLFSRGRSKGVANVLSGQAEDTDFVIFDYQYTTGSGKNSSTSRQTVLLLRHPDWDIPPFQLQPETVFSRVAHALGFDDVNFEGHPTFSTRFNLRGSSPDRVREFFTPDLREFFEAQQKICAEGDRTRLILYRWGSRVAPAEIASLVETGWQARAALAGRPAAQG